MKGYSCHSSSLPCLLEKGRDLLILKLERERWVQSSRRLAATTMTWTAMGVISRPKSLGGGEGSFDPWLWVGIRAQSGCCLGFGAPSVSSGPWVGEGPRGGGAAWGTSAACPGKSPASAPLALARWWLDDLSRNWKRMHLVLGSSSFNHCLLLTMPYHDHQLFIHQLFLFYIQHWNSLPKF